MLQPASEDPVQEKNGGVRQGKDRGILKEQFGKLTYTTDKSKNFSFRLGRLSYLLSFLHLNGFCTNRHFYTAIVMENFYEMCLINTGVGKIRSTAVHMERNTKINK